MPGSAPARILPGNLVHAIRGRITFAQQGITAGVEIGTLPAGCQVLRTAAHVKTLFNGTSPTVDVGTAGSASAFAATAGVIPGTAGFKPALTGTGNGDTLTADTPVVVRVGGTGATTGDVDLVIEFYPQKT